MALLKNLLYIIIFSAIFNVGCKKIDNPTTEKKYRIEESIIVDNLKRYFLLNLPPNYFESKEKISLVIALHGGGGGALQFEKSSLLTEKANKENFIIVYPEGVESDGILKAKTWNAAACCDYAAEKNINDVKFISTLIDKLVLDYAIDPTKVYATGHSNGGMLCYRLACEIPYKIAAIAPNACAMVTEACNSTKPIPILHMHSVLDKNIPYLGGKGGGISTRDLTLKPVESVLNTWAKTNQCATEPIVIKNAKFTHTTWNNCSKNSNIEYYLTADGGHSWPGGLAGSLIGDIPSTSINANDLLWAFFKLH